MTGGLLPGGLLPADWASQFFLPPSGPYLASHAAGCQPRAAGTTLESHMLNPWATVGGAWDNWLAVIGEWRGALATLFAVAADDLCPAPNLTAALGTYLSALGSATARRTILLAPSAFPTIGFAASGMVAQGWTVRYLPPAADVRDAKSWTAAMDDDVALVVVMHVTSNSGALTDPAAIATAAHLGGARMIVDCAQSAGICPVSPAAWGADAAIGSCLKWLCGGPGAGWLWVAPHDRTALEPALRGWWSHADPFAMDIGNFRYAPDARRWWGGTPSVAPFALALAGVSAVADVGVPAIRAHNLALQDNFRQRLEPVTPQWEWPAGDIGGTLCIDVGADQPRVAAAIAAHRIHADFRGATLRLSFHGYNNVDDAAHTADALLSA